MKYKLYKNGKAEWVILSEGKDKVHAKVYDIELGRRITALLNGEVLYIAQVTTNDTATVNFVGEELYEKFKRHGDPFAMKVIKFA